MFYWTMNRLVISQKNIEKETNNAIGVLFILGDGKIAAIWSK